MADTIPSSPSTSASISVGNTTNGTLDFVGDHDWYRINLVQGQAITVTLNGLTITDTFLRIYNSAGTQVLFENDDLSGGSFDSRISFIAPTTGTYYIDVGAFDDAESGNFQLTVSTYSPPPVATFEEIADQLINGYWGGDSHHFNVGPGGTLTVNLTTLTASGQTLARAALALWADITGIHFQEVSGGEQILFTDHDEDAFTEANWSAGITSHARVNISTDWLATNGTSLTSYSFTTYVHEIGHALGLGHAGNYNGDATYPYDAEFQNDSWATSVMSYFSQQESTYFAGQGFDQNFPTTPMIADILAMQQMYGLSTTTRAGNTTYGSTWGTGMGAITIYDAGGVDTIDVSISSLRNQIDLNPGTFSSIMGETGNVGIALGVIIENATTGSARDTLTGNDVANVLQSGGNNDTLNGGGGNDTLTGDSGADVLTGGAGSDTFRDSRSGLNGDTITDFGAGDKIVFTDASLATFTFNLTGSTLFFSGGSITLSGGVSGTITASAAAGGGVQLALQVVNTDAAHDFNGDGRSDLMWRNDAGSLSEFLGQASGGFSWNGNAAYTVGNDWSIKGFGDFNGDGRDDILWRQDASGTMMVWNAQPGGTFAWAVNYALPTSLKFNAVGDFNGDGRDDIMWRDSSGALSEWLGQQNGSFAWNPNAGYQLDSSWDIVGSGDFNGDGKDDILWRQAGTGSVMEWLGQTGGTFAWAANYAIGTNFHLAGVGDFNGDNRDDLMWRSNTGALSEWTAGAGGNFAWNPALGGTVSNSLQVASIGDFNGDNIDDIEWRNDATGAITGWLGQSNGTFVANPLGDFALGTAWHSQPPPDHFL